MLTFSLLIKENELNEYILNNEEVINTKYY